jgi:hypothetical protein
LSLRINCQSAPKFCTPTDTDQDEVLFTAARPVILNGIEDVIARPDLADRAILLTPAPIGETQRRPETTLWQEFERAQPQILGALLDAAGAWPA